MINIKENINIEFFNDVEKLYVFTISNWFGGTFENLLYIGSVNSIKDETVKDVFEYKQDLGYYYNSQYFLTIKDLVKSINDDKYCVIFKKEF